MRQDFSAISRQLRGVLDWEGFSDDPSQDVLILISLAYARAMELDGKVDIMFNGRRLALDPLEKAFQESLLLRKRLHNKYPVQIDTTYFSKLGRVIK